MLYFISSNTVWIQIKYRTHNFQDGLKYNCSKSNENTVFEYDTTIQFEIQLHLRISTVYYGLHKSIVNQLGFINIVKWPRFVFFTKGKKGYLFIAGTQHFFFTAMCVSVVIRQYSSLQTRNIIMPKTTAIQRQKNLCYFLQTQCWKKSLFFGEMYYKVVFGMYFAHRIEQEKHVCQMVLSPTRIAIR